MDSLFSILLLLVAAIVAMLTYMYVQSIPVIALTSASAIALAAGVWWHWTEFAIEYRTSTWQEQLRSYASYALLLVVILLSYAFYVFGWKNSSLSELATRAATTVRATGRNAAQKIISGTTRTLSSASNVLLKEDSPTMNVSAKSASPNILM
jgi:hypothetical protein